MRASEKMAMSEDGVVRVVGARLAQKNRILWNKAGLQGLDLAAARESCEVKRAENLGRNTNGSALKTIATSNSFRRAWMMDANLKSGNKILIWKAMSGTIPTKINLTRGMPDQALKKCRRCGNTPETDGHILAGCHTSRDAFSKRHNMLCDKVAKELRLNGGPSRRVWRERTCFSDGRQYKPDIVVRDDNIITVVDMTCPYEKSEDYLHSREDDKVTKYEPLKRDKQWTREIEVLFDTVFERIEIVRVAIGAIGTITSRTLRKLNELKLGKIAKSLQMIASNCSAQIIRGHLSR